MHLCFSYLKYFYILMRKFIYKHSIYVTSNMKHHLPYVTSTYLILSWHILRKCFNLKFYSISIRKHHLSMYICVKRWIRFIYYYLFFFVTISIILRLVLLYRLTSSKFRVNTYQKLYDNQSPVCSVCEL